MNKDNKTTRQSSSDRSSRSTRTARRKKRTEPTVTRYDVTTRETTPITARPNGVLKFFIVIAASIVTVVVLFNVIGLIVGAVTNHSSDVDTSADSADAMAAAADRSAPRFVKVTFAGDCTLGTDENFDYSASFNQMYEDVEDASWFLANVADIFSEDDLTIVNMEGTLTDSDDRADKTFAFKGEPEYAEVLATASVEAASMANNHSRDYGEESFEDTESALQNDGIVTFGYDDIEYMDVNDVKVALIGCNDVNTDSEEVKESAVANIERAKDEGAELVIVYAHWGIEHEYEPSETQIEMGHAFVDAGADLVVGSHPHVIQGYEIYEGRYIVYSVGNFCFGGNSDPSDKDCIIFQQSFTVSGDEVEKNDDVSFIPCSVSSKSSYNNYQPTPATGEERERILQKFAQIN